MLDINYIRQNTEEVKQAAKNKLFDPQIIDDVLEVDSTRRELIKK